MLSRRAFLAGSAGLVGLTAAAFATRQGAAGRPAPITAVFRSRPDLAPPVVRVARGVGATGAGLLFLTPNGALTPGMMIVNDHGELVWWRPAPAQPTANLRVQEYGGEPVLTWWEGQVDGGGHGQGEYVILDRSYTERLRVRAGNGFQGDLHEFLLTPHGTALLTAYHPVATDLSSVGGAPAGTVLDSIIQEVDVGSGRVVFEWHSIDHVEPSESHSAPGAGAPFDYFHINSIDVDGDGDLLVSARNTWAIYKLDRKSGDVRWRLGGKRSDFAMADGTAFAWQHDARRQADGSITLFDDGASPQVEPQSRGLTLRVDETAETVSLERTYVHPRPILAGSQGNLQVLSNGNVLIGWGAQPYLSEFSSDGRLLFDAQLPAGSYSYRAFRFPWRGQPAEAPSVHVASDPSGMAVAAASWNGATDVDRWQVLEGPAADRLRPLVSRPSTGFETRVWFRSTRPFVAVRALDARGAVLGTSTATRVLTRV